METKKCPSCGKSDTTDFSTCRFCQERYDYIPKTQKEEFDIGAALRSPIGFFIFLVLVAVVFKPVRDLVMGAAVVNQIDNTHQAITVNTAKLKQNPKDYDALINRGDAYMVMFKSNLAAEDYSAAIAVRPISAEAYRKRADAYKALSDNVNAEKDLQKAATLEK
jgi:tetratricopeptide (TPR) repeat protein